jgi:hypothetical protein
LGVEATCERDDEVLGHAKVSEGLAERVDIALSLALLLSLAFSRLQATAYDSVGRLFDLSFGAGQGGFLRLVWD